MWEEDTGVATAHWESEAAIGMIAAVRDGVGSFAGRHGMPRDGRENVRAAVAEAVADAVIRGRRADEPGRVFVDAATDGAWLSVRIRDDGPGCEDGPAGGLPLVTCLPHSLEWDADREGTHVLMEFAMAPAASPVQGGLERTREAGRGRRCDRRAAPGSGLRRRR